MTKVLNSKIRSSYSDDLINDLTKEMDKFSVYSEGVFSTYLYNEKIQRGADKYHMLIRYPGATRGYLVLDKDNIIKDIVLYNDSCFDSIKQYDKGVKKAVQKFIGYKLEF